MTNFFEFQITASGIDHETDDFEDRFFDAGCDDATIIFQGGVIILDFVREGSDVLSAIRDAIVQVRKAGATIISVEPSDHVTISEIARRTKISRAAVSNYALGKRKEDFPLPVDRITTESPVWSWQEVSVWLFETGRLDQQAVEMADAIKQVCSDLRNPIPAGVNLTNQKVA